MSGWAGPARSSRIPGSAHYHKGSNTYIVSDLTEEDFDEYYNGFANRVLWPILHYRLDLAEFSRRDLSGYLRVNEHFADELAKVLEPDDIVWVHDYHLIPLAKALRERNLHNKVGFFLHIPMPPPEIITAMPNHEHLIPALCHYDLVGFQTDNDAANFARYLANELGRPSHISRRLGTGDRVMRIGVFPVGIEPRGFARLARRAVKSELVRKVVKSIPGALMIGVDRLDYSKGIALRLEAYERFLAANPAWHGKITYLQITPKSRSQIKEYADMEDTVNATAGRINGTYSRCLLVAHALCQSALQPHRLVGPLPQRQGGVGDALARRHESRGQGICRRPGCRRSRCADPVAVRRRGGGVQGGCALGEPL